jgi:cytochrome c
MSTPLRIGCVALAVSFAAACGAAKSDEPQHPSATHETHQANVTEVSEGAALYATNCSGCHGATGKGTAVVPAVVGENALPLAPGPKSQVRKTEFRTAKDVFDFIRTTMPANKPGSLSDNTYYAILAYDLKLNGIDLQGMKVDPTTVGMIRLPGR